MELKAIISGIEGLKARGNLSIDITSVESDSRKINKNSLFVAIKGFEVDGHKFIKQAIQNGATAVMIQAGEKLNKADIPDDLTIIMAPDTRIALAKIACNFYGNPAGSTRIPGHCIR